MTEAKTIVTQLLLLAGIVLGTMAARGALAADRGANSVPAGAGLQSNHIGGFDRPPQSWPGNAAAGLQSIESVHDAAIAGAADLPCESGIGVQGSLIRHSTQPRQVGLDRFAPIAHADDFVRVFIRRIP
jgi:hypothetical protein